MQISLIDLNLLMARLTTQPGYTLDKHGYKCLDLVTKGLLEHVRDSLIKEGRLCFVPSL